MEKLRLKCRVGRGFGEFLSENAHKNPTTPFMKTKNTKLRTRARLTSLLALISAVGLLGSDVVQAQQDESQSYLKLRDIYHMDTHDSKNRRDFHKNNKIQLNGARGGEFILVSKHRPDTHRDGAAYEQSRFNWSFSKDVSILRAGEKFTAELSAKLDSAPVEDSITPDISIIGATNTLSPAVKWYREDKGLTDADGGRLQSLISIPIGTPNYATFEQPGPAVTDWRPTVSRPVSVLGSFPRLSQGSKNIAAFIVTISAYTRNSIDNCVYQIVYVYDVVEGSPDGSVNPGGIGSGWSAGSSNEGRPGGLSGSGDSTSDADGGSGGNGLGSGGTASGRNTGTNNDGPQAGGSGDGGAGADGVGDGRPKAPSREEWLKEPGHGNDSIHVAVPGASDGMILRADKRRVFSGQTVMIPVWLHNGDGLADMNFDVLFDSSVAKIEGKAVKGNLLPGSGRLESNPDESPNKMWLGLVPEEGGVKGAEGTVVQIPFVAVGKPGTRTTLELVVRKFSMHDKREKVYVGTVDGEIEIIDETDLAGEGDSGSTKGDGNEDGKLDGKDWRDALRMSVKLLAEDIRYDMDGDRRITSTDAKLIRDEIMRGN